MAAGTMETIKKKMQTMRLDKENSVLKAQALETKLNEQKALNEAVSEVLRQNVETYLL